MNRPTLKLAPSKWTSQRGCRFERLGPDAVRVWREGPCYSCNIPISLTPSSVYCLDDKDPLQHGLILSKTPMPPEGYSIYTGSMLYCGACAGVWKDPTKRNTSLREPFHE